MPRERLADGPSSLRTTVRRLPVMFEEKALWIVAAALSAVVFAAWAAGRLKPLWYDEIFSVIVARSTSWSEMKVAMSVDANPPLLGLLIKASTRLFGSSDFAVRLPSLLGFLGALVGVYVFTRREASRLVAVIAMGLVLAEPALSYSYEGRPYALLLGFMMLGLVSWQSATRTIGGRGLALFGIWVAFVLSMLSHNLGLVETGLPLVFGEVARSLNRRRMDWPIWLAGVASLPVLIFTYPLSRRTNELLLSWNRANVYPLTKARFVEFWIQQPLNSFRLLINPALILLLAIILFFHARRSDRWQAVRTSPAVWAAIGACLLIPVTYLIMTASSGYFNCRYGIGSVAGIALFFALVYARTARVSGMLLVLLATALLGRCVFDATRDALQPMIKLPIEVELTRSAGLPYVVANPFTMMPHWYYGSQQDRSRLVFLRDQPDAIKERYIIVDICITTVGDLAKINVADALSYAATHPRFLFENDGTVPARSLETLLRANGFSFQVQPQYGQSVYLASRAGS